MAGAQSNKEIQKMSFEDALEEHLRNFRDGSPRLLMMVV